MSAPKTAPCRICGKRLPLPPWPIVEDSVACLEHSTPGVAEWIPTAPTEKSYMLTEIKTAFRSMFHASGEWFFPYEAMGATEEECAQGVDSVWKDLQARLEGTRS